MQFIEAHLSHASGSGIVSIYKNFSANPTLFVDRVYDGLQYCHNGGDLVNFLNMTDWADLNSYVDNFVNNANFTSEIESVNIT